MGLLRNARDRFLPASNRTTVERSDQQLEELNRLRADFEEERKRSAEARTQVRETQKTVAQLKRDLASMRSELVFEQHRTRCIDECMQVMLAMQARGEKSILLAGWYGAGNTGDDLMMETMLASVPESLRNNLYVLMSQDSAYDMGRIFSRGAHVVHYPVTPQDIDVLAQAFDGVVWGGGAIVDEMQYDDKPRNISTGNLFIRLSEAMLAAGKPVAACGVSATSTVSSPDFVSHLQHIIDASARFSVRDAYSLEALSRAGVDVGRVKRCEDILFASDELQGLSWTAPGHPVVGFLPLYIPEMHEANVAVLNRLVEASADDESAEIHLIPFYQRADPDYLARLRAACCESERVTIEPFAATLSDSPLLGCSHIVTSRYHAAVIAAALGIPFTCLVPDAHRHYPNKMRHLVENVCDGYGAHLFLASDIVKSEQALSELVETVQQGDSPRLARALHEEVSSELRAVWACGTGQPEACL